MKNWKTTLSGIGVASLALLNTLAILPAQLGDISTIIPEAWKTRILSVSLAAAFALRVYKSIVTADAPPAK